MQINQQISQLLAESKKISFAEPQNSYNLAEEAFSIASENELELEKGQALYHMAYACRVMSDYSNGLDKAFQSFDIVTKLKDNSSVVKVRNIIGIIYFYYGAYVDALEHFEEALNLIDALDFNLESSILNNIGEIYREAHELDRALKYYKKALKISLEHHLELNASAIYLNIGEIYFKQHKHKQSLESLMKSYEFVKNTDDLISQGEVETKLGRGMFVQGDYSAAHDYFVSACMKLNQVSNKFYLVDTLQNMAQLDRAIGEDPLNHLLEALNHSLNKKLDHKISQIYKLIAEYYEEKNDYKLALEHYKLYHMKEKEIEASNLSKRLEVFSVEFNSYKEKYMNIEFKKISEKLQRDILKTKSELDEIKNKNNYLMKENIIDTLTKLYNRRGIDKMFAQVENSNSDDLAVVFLVDIDFFKHYNDALGHIQGDHCLALISRKLKALPYKDSFIGRYGGEEFLCYFKINNKSEADEIGEVLRKTIESLMLSYIYEGTKRHITVSVGGKICLINNKNRIDIINESDQALYRAKSEGRNKVVVFI